MPAAQELEIPGGYMSISEDEVIDVETGEVLDLVTERFPKGSRVITPVVQRRIQGRREKEKKADLLKFKNDDLGKFCFVNDEKDFSDVRPETLTRVFFLYSYLGKNREIKVNPKGKAVRVNELPRVLNIARSTAASFWEEVNGKYFVEKDGEIYGTEDMTFFKGTINWKKSDTTYYQRAYRDGIRKLYKETSPGQHKRLGYIFRLLPLINHEYNVLCSNPYEDDKDCIDVVTFREFGRYIGYNESNLSRLRREMAEIKFTPKGKAEKEPFVAFVSTGEYGNDYCIIVNPRIIYGGEDYRRVEAFELFFRK